MIGESGRVVAVEADCLWVETLRKSTCNSCVAQKGCGHGILNQLSPGRTHHLRVLFTEQSGKNFKVDDQVELQIPERLLVNGALLVYVMPLVCLLAGAMLVSYWWPGDVTAFLGAMGGLAMGFGLLRYHSLKNRNNPHLQPLIAACSAQPEGQALTLVDPG